MPDLSSKINDREKQICERIKAIRESRGWTQKVLGMAIGIGRDKLANIEAGRTPLRADVAIKLAGFTGGSLKWLATGLGPEKGPLPESNLIVAAPKNVLFSKAWDEFFSKAAVFDAPIISRESVSAGGASALEYSVEEIEGAFKNLPAIYHANFFAHIHRATSDFFKMNMYGIADARLKVDRGEKLKLTKSATFSNITDVKVQPQWPSLKRRLQEATAKAGTKSKLAKFLKVDLTRVSQWLSDSENAREPGAEYALRMLFWVEHPEVQQ